jgi:hypothetical protein
MTGFAGKAVHPNKRLKVCIINNSNSELTTFNKNGKDTISGTNNINLNCRIFIG